ncbi:MAG TPA: JAB domain-containing protein [Smithellaceae bacterium]|nr:JAB domain-containing protein [Smithellaceae bacterium]
MPAEEKIEQPDYFGHRQRLKARFEQTGFHGFQDYEVLEFLLYFVLPRKDTKPIAKKLLKRFHNFIGAIHADSRELQKSEGIGSHAAHYLKAIGASISFYFDEKAKQEDFQFTNLDELVDYFRAAVGRTPNEVLRILYLNSKNMLIDAGNLSEETVSEAVAFPRRIVEGTLKYRAKSVIIGHYHPGGLPEPSDNDNAVTEEIMKALKTVGISLQEHVIIAADGFYSYRQNSLLG